MLRTNPAVVVRGPAYSVNKGKTPVLDETEARTLLESIDVSTVVGLRDRALIGVMLYAFARVSATTGMTVADYYQSGKRWMVRIHEKGGKVLEIPAHHKAEVFLDEYLAAAGFGENRKHPLFPTADRMRQLTSTPMTRSDVLRMIKRRAREAGLPETMCCHTFRGTGITNFITHGGTVEKAQAIAGHADPRTTKLYDRSRDSVTLDDIERITI